VGARNSIGASRQISKATKLCPRQLSGFTYRRPEGFRNGDELERTSNTPVCTNRE
jgi:hypothetical protein